MASSTTNFLEMDSSCSLQEETITFCFYKFDLTRFNTQSGYECNTVRITMLKRVFGSSHKMQGERLREQRSAKSTIDARIGPYVCSTKYTKIKTSQLGRENEVDWHFGMSHEFIFKYIIIGKVSRDKSFLPNCWFTTHTRTNWERRHGCRYAASRVGGNYCEILCRQIMSSAPVYRQEMYIIFFSCDLEWLLIIEKYTHTVMADCPHTIGVEFGTRVIEIANKHIKLQIVRLHHV